MLTISTFYGILIRMFFYDTDKHNMPHIHAEFQGNVGVYSIPDGEFLAGNLPQKKHKIEAHLKATPPDIAQQLNKADQKTVRRTPHTPRS